MSASARANAVLRAGILRAADDRHVKRFMGRYGMRLGAARFVAGETLDECVVALRRLADQGLHANTTLLGESIRDRAQAFQLRVADRFAPRERIVFPMLGSLRPQADDQSDSALVGQTGVAHSAEAAP